MMTNAINVAVIGYGYWGPNLARNFHQLPEARLALVADLDAARLAEVARLYPTTTVTTDYRQALARPEIVAVAVATPVRTHFAIAQEALLAGKHVLVEKPLALTAAEAEALIALAEQQQRTLMVGHTFEYNPAVWKIKELIAAGEIGQVYYAYANRVNLGRVQWDINALWNIAPHDVSILLYLLEAMPLEVSARGAVYLSQGVEDVVFLTLTFPGNVLAHVQASWLDPSKVRRLTIVGSEKMIVYDDVDNEAKVKIYDKGVYRKGNAAYGEFQFRVHSGDIHIPRIDMTEPLRNECAHFIECVRTGQRPRTDGACGLRVVRVLEAAQRSLERGGASVQV
ncbi:MAG: Gfo/Idh/MocA family oxidoreductase [Chloroflexi bacterium]|nr:Gfo/Idh/MocA family oxidoreductase [Chloroflexota bacterium]